MSLRSQPMEENASHKATKARRVALCSWRPCVSASLFKCDGRHRGRIADAMARASRCLALIVVLLATLAGCAGDITLELVNLPNVLPLRGQAEEGTIQASGAIEAERVTVSSELTGRVVRVYVDEGDAVSPGQTLVELDDALLEAQIQGAQAELEAAEAELARLLAGPRPTQIAGQEAAIEVAKARVAGARQAWEDALRLRDNPLELDARIRAAESEWAVAQARVDLARAALSEAEVRHEASAGGGSDVEKTTHQILAVQVQAARANLELAELATRGAGETLEQLRRLRAAPAELEAAVHRAEMNHRLALEALKVEKAELALLKAGARPEEVALARRKVDLARASVRALEVQREKHILRAPIAGVVASRVIHDGETAVAGATLMTIADLSSARLIIYVPEHQIGRVHLGQPAAVRVDSHPGRVFEGRVIHIAAQAEFTPRNVQTKEDRATTVFAVKIGLDNPERILKPGMPADAELLEAGG